MSGRAGWEIGCGLVVLLVRSSFVFRSLNLRNRFLVAFPFVVEYD